MTSFRPKKWNDKISDTKSGTVSNGFVRTRMNAQNWSKKWNDESFALGACVCVVVVESER